MHYQRAGFNQYLNETSGEVKTKSETGADTHRPAYPTHGKIPPRRGRRNAHAARDIRTKRQKAAEEGIRISRDRHQGPGETTQAENITAPSTESDPPWYYIAKVISDARCSDYHSLMYYKSTQQGQSLFTHDINVQERPVTMRLAKDITDTLLVDFFPPQSKELREQSRKVASMEHDRKEE